MTFVRANAFGWGLFELLTSSQMNVIDSQMPFALDGRDGGTYNPLDGLLLDGSAIATANPTLKLIDTATQAALEVRSTHTGGKGLKASATVNTQLLEVIGAALAQVPDPTALTSVIGHSNTLGKGGDAAVFTGGASTLATSSGIGGVGFSAFGGQGVLGGSAIAATAGASNLTGLGAGSSGAAAIGITPATTIGDDAGQIAGAAIVATAPSMTGVGLGGFGAIIIGGYGGSANPAGADMGVGLFSVGAPGVHGLNGPLFAGLPAEFEFMFGNQSGVRASGKLVGRAFLSEFSGGTTAAEMNRFALIGTPATGGKIVQIESAPSVAPGGVTTGLTITSGVNAGVFRALDAFSRQSVAARFSAAAGAGGINLHAPLQLLLQSEGPNLLDQGGLTHIDKDATAITGLLDDQLFFGSGPGRAYYDRVVGSADRAAAWAWGKFTTDGVGGVALGTNYGSATVANTGTFVTEVTLDAIVGQPSNLIVIALCQGGAGNPRFVVATPVIAAYPTANTIQFSIITSNTGAAINVNATALTVHYLVFGASSFGTAADRPTFYRP